MSVKSIFGTRRRGGDKPAAMSSEHHQVIRTHLQHDKRFSYYLQWPDSPDARRVLVLIHGISRNASALMNAFAPFALEAGYTVIAPVFARGICGDFQRLGRRGKGPRADWILDAILDEMGAQVGLHLPKFDVFGFSAGAQFAHRYAMAHPQRIRTMTLGSAGWYTLPNQDRYPYGLRLRRELPGVAFAPPRFLRVPVRVYVGSADTERDAALNRSRRVEKKQGPHRVARAQTWVDTMNRCAAELGLSQPATLELMPAVGHSFSEAVEKYQLPQKIMQWMTNHDQPGMEVSSARSEES